LILRTAGLFSSFFSVHSFRLPHPVFSHREESRDAFFFFFSHSCSTTSNQIEVNCWPLFTRLTFISAPNTVVSLSRSQLPTHKVLERTEDSCASRWVWGGTKFPLHRQFGVLFLFWVFSSVNRFFPPPQGPVCTSRRRFFHISSTSSDGGALLRFFRVPPRQEPVATPVPFVELELLPPFLAFGLRLVFRRAPTFPKNPLLGLGLPFSFFFFV